MPKTDTYPSYEPIRMKSRYREIVRLHTIGYQDSEIAEMVGCERRTVSYVIQARITSGMVEDLRDRRDQAAVDIAARIRSFAPLALEVATEILTDETASKSVRASIASDILDRAGYKPVNMSFQASAKLSSEDIDHLKQVARSNGIVEAEEVHGD